MKELTSEFKISLFSYVPYETSDKCKDGSGKRS
jgi:hypothetical protein